MLGSSVAQGRRTTAFSKGGLFQPMIPWFCWLQKLSTFENLQPPFENPDCCLQVTGYKVMGEIWEKEWEKCEMKRLRKNVVPHRIIRMPDASRQGLAH